MAVVSLEKASIFQKNHGFVTFCYGSCSFRQWPSRCQQKMDPLNIFRKNSVFASFTWLSKNVRLKQKYWVFPVFLYKKTTYLFSIQLFKYCISMVLLLFATFETFNNCHNYLNTLSRLLFLQKNKQVDRENIAQRKKTAESTDVVQNFD